MDNKLLVRIYNVGLGDCIYLRIPDKEVNRHVLIDCGNTYADKDVLEKAVTNLSSELEKDKTNKLLDLLVVTHPHQDHIAGFDVCLGEFKKIKIGKVLLSASMNPKHDHAPKTLALQQFSSNALKQLSQLSLNPTFDTLINDMLGLSNDGALEALRITLPEQSDAKVPQYVHDGISLDEVFSDDENIKLTVLGPANNIDGEYLGKIEDVLQNFMGMSGMFGMGDEPNIAANWNKPEKIPTNISKSDFFTQQEGFLLTCIFLTQAC